MPPRNRNEGLDAQPEVKAPEMHRSQSQLAGAYAPGVFFPFEGGMGACIALPSHQTPHNTYTPTEAVRGQIHLRLSEAIELWTQRAQIGADASNPPFPIELCIDERLIHGGRLMDIQLDRFMLLKPVDMGYTIAPLTFVCDHDGCGLYRNYRTVKDAHISLRDLTHCPHCRRQSRWRQLDVIHVHPSGGWVPLRPGRYEWREGRGGEMDVQEPNGFCSHCSSRNFRLSIDPRGPSHWRFVCAQCGTPDYAMMRQNDPDTLRVLREEAAQHIGRARMEVISYRASAAHYAHSEQFVLFGRDNPEIMVLMDRSRQADLIQFIARRFGFGDAQRPPIPAIIDALKEQGEQALAEELAHEMDQHVRLQSVIETVQLPKETLPAMREAVDAQARKIENWIQTQLNTFPNLFPGQSAMSDAADRVFEQRNLFSMRFDPFRLAVEHEALRISVLESSGRAGRRPYVPFIKPDNDIAPKDIKERTKQSAEVQALLPRLGLLDAGLVREFNICRMTYGFTRVSNQPVLDRPRAGLQGLPVRLKLFPSAKNDAQRPKIPIYIIDQTNEAYYFRLNPTTVDTWLRYQPTTPEDLFEWSPKDTVHYGGRLIERGIPFGRFLEHLRSDQMGLVYPLVYGLLHSYAHVLMKVIAERSGLDLGSMGEYIFPADIAFVIYRNGTTIDLGNLSSLWRNDNVDILHEILAPHTTECGSGSLCDEAGGACPDCIMIPETACLAQNKLLSRAYLQGGPAPWQPHSNNRMRGFLEVANA